MMPTTPSGTRTRVMARPLGRFQRAVTSPTGSGRAAISSSPLAMASMRLASRVRRSRKAGVGRPSRAAARSRALASRMAAVCARSSRAAALSAASLASVEARASAREASRALPPRAAIMSATDGAAATALRARATGRAGFLPAEAALAAALVMCWALDLRGTAEAAQGRLLRPGLAPAQDHIVAVHQSGAAGKAEDGGDLAALLADDARRILAGVGHEAAAELAPVGAADDNGIAALEVAAHARHPGRQQALARVQRPLGAGVDLHEPPGLQLAGDPALARGDGVGRSQ